MYFFVCAYFLKLTSKKSTPNAQKRMKKHYLLKYFFIRKIIYFLLQKKAQYSLIRDFQRETNTFLDPEKQIKHEEMEKEWDLER